MLTNYFNLKSLLFSIGVTSILLSSCHDSNNSNTGTNEFIVNRDNLQGTITKGTVTLESGIYKLTGPLTVADGATLVINPGVTIEAQNNGVGGYIAVEQGGKINATGTASSPIIFTSISGLGGSWGGLVLCGKAPINKGATAQAEVTGLTYGGTDVHDNSGTLSYVVIIGSGSKISGTKEFNGLSCFGVGDGTTLDHIQVIRGSDDAYEFFGGTVKCTNLVATDFEDDGFDWTEGWQGGITFGYANTQNTVASDDSRGLEGDNLETNHEALPMANPTMSNITVVGRSTAPVSGSQKEAFKIRRGTQGNFTNLYSEGFTKGLSIENDATITNLNNGTLKFNMINVVGASASNSYYAIDNNGVVTDITTKVTVDPTILGAGNKAGTPAWATGWTR